MNRNEIMNTIEMLSHSQGFYGRLLNAIRELPDDEKDRFFKHLESHNFSDPLDLVLYFEC